MLGDIMHRDIKLALNICTYKREEYVREHLSRLLKSDFFKPKEMCFGDLEIFIVDNASELNINTQDKVHLIYNENTGGAGGFQRGLEEIRKYGYFTHVIFMDDDIRFELESFYILYDFLKSVDDNCVNRPVAGRMLDMDNPNIQWTAAEKWNGGDIKHMEFLRDITDRTNPYTPGKVVYDADADYGGFWFCCYPYSFVKDNDILPLFLHCDDVEYGLRCGKRPIVIEGVHIWHARWDKKQNNLLDYYDYRNTIIVNLMYGYDSLNNIRDRWFEDITKAHVDRDYKKEYLYILAYYDAISGRIYKANNRGEKGNNRVKRLLDRPGNIWRNRIFWRIVDWKVKMQNG